LTRSLFISRLRQQGIRNLRSNEIECCPHLNVFWGDNGQGKTSLLEALSVATTSRSFRTDQARDLIQHGVTAATAEVDVCEAGLERTQRVVLGLGRKQTLLDGKRIARAADFAVVTPIVVFHPSDLNLISGPAALRRTLLTRVSLYLEPWNFDSHKAYQLALRERQRLLLERGPSAPGLDAFEQVAANLGVIVSTAYASAAQRLHEALSSVIPELLPTQLLVETRYVPAGTTSVDEFRSRLCEYRPRDLSRGRALYGPQRDDIQIWIDGADARRHASQGQQRLLALALKLAELAAIRSVRHVHPILLLDDVSSELDPRRTDALLEWLRNSQSQVFITTTRWSAEDCLNPIMSRRFFRLQGGVAEQKTSPLDDS
jgi:DNA replication and repair protein RecF